MNNKPHSEETKHKISLALKGHKLSDHTKKRLLEANLGIPRKEETKQKISNSMRGRSTAWLTGRKLSPESIQKRSSAVLGTNHWNWKGGVTPANHQIRQSLAMKEWRRHVFQRDNYTCQSCAQRGGILHADHELPFAHFPNLRFEILNGQTLCEPCHRTKTSADNARYKLEANLFI